MVEDLVQDAKFYQNTALELQGAYKDLYQWQVELQGKYDEQSKHLKEASMAIKATDAEAKQRHQALLDVQCNKQQEFDQAIEGAVQQYKVQLNTAQSKLQARDQEHQLTIKQLQDKISMLEITSASQANLPSVATSNPQDRCGLHSQIFGYVPGTVNTKRGAAKYDSQDQAFSFSHKQVRFQDGGSSPNLDIPPMVGQGSQSSTPYHTSNAALNRTFDVSQISPLALAGVHQDVAVIAAEISVATAAQAPKEFQPMWEPKIIKLKGGYLADAELMFWSWHVDIEAQIVDHDLNNPAALQLIKDQTLEGVCHEVKYQLNLCRGVINYCKLLKYLSVMFQGGEDKANILTEFYSQAQKPKESEETFMDELQLLTCKVISKRPAFREGLDTTLKQHYANQLYDRNNSSIAKTLLLQMPMVTFTQFCNELARVLGTCQHKDKPKSVTTNQVKADLGETESVSKSHLKCDAKSVLNLPKFRICIVS